MHCIHTFTPSHETGVQSMSIFQNIIYNIIPPSLFTTMFAYIKTILKNEGWIGLDYQNMIT
jgi:hypothetical protein